MCSACVAAESAPQRQSTRPHYSVPVDILITARTIVGQQGMEVRTACPVSHAARTTFKVATKVPVITFAPPITAITALKNQKHRCQHPRRHLCDIPTVSSHLGSQSHRGPCFVNLEWLGGALVVMSRRATLRMPADSKLHREWI